MRLTAGGCRELHWHNAGERAIMPNGNVRITAMDLDGKGFVDNLKKDALWFFPTGVPHSILTRHTPPEVLAKNWGVSQSAVAPIGSRRKAITYSTCPYPRPSMTITERPVVQKACRHLIFRFL